MADIPKKLGRYEIAERVGRGGMGVLYRGRDPVLDREVAIKVMHADFSGDDTARPRFFREARAAAKLQHRNIVTIFEFDEEDGVPYIVMEFLRGRSLSARLSSPPPLTLVDKIDVVAQLCTGLSFAHLQGVVHRDVKPANVWVQDDGTIKLLDFGIAKVSSATITIGSDILGSAPYMAPEQVGGQQVDGRADIFSAGAILYELLSGRRPFRGDSATAVMMHIVTGEPTPINQIVPDLPAALVAAVGRALQKSPDNRYASAQALAADLRQIRRSLQVSEDLDSGSFGDSRVSATVRLPIPPRQPVGAQAAPPGDLSITQYEPAIGAEAPDVISQAPSRGKRLAVVFGGALLVMAGIAGLWFMKGQPASASDSSVQLPQGSPTTLAQPAGKPRTVQVTSEPKGATITLDEVEVGETDGSIEIAAGAPGVLRLTRRNYAPREVTLSAEELEAGKAHFNLADNRPVTLTATGSYPFRVMEGKRVVRAAAESHTVALTGIRRLRLVAEEHFLDQLLTVNPADGNSRVWTAPETGVLHIILEGEWKECRVLLNGRPVGRTVEPVPQVFEVTATCGDGRTDSQSKTTDLRTNTVKFPK